MIDLRVVLVAPKYPRNVGMVSRIMCNYDLNRLILVRPQCDLNLEAKQGAAQGQIPLSNVTVYSQWTDFNANEDEGLRIGFSRRQGRRRPSEPLHELISQEDVDFGRPTYLFFGAEDHGLSSEDLDLCHRLVFFDLPGTMQSMNLSHAVLLAISQFHSKFSQVQSQPLTTKPGISDPEPFLRQWLEALEFDLDSQKKWNALIMLKQLLLRAAPTPEELHKFEMIVQQTLRRIRN